MVREVAETPPAHVKRLEALAGPQYGEGFTVPTMRVPLRPDGER